MNYEFKVNNTFKATSKLHFESNRIYFSRNENDLKLIYEIAENKRERERQIS